MEIQLLGPVELRSSTGPVSLGPPQQRAVLAMLAVDPRRSVPTALMIERLWEERPPRDAPGALYTHISRLRSVLRPVGGGIVRRGGGYLLDIEPDQVDLARCRRLAAEGRSQASEGPESAGRALQLFLAACRLWKGTALADIKGDWATRLREALHQERLALLVSRFEVQLRLGQHADAIPALAAELATYPLSEALAGLQLVALYRAGRQAEALDVYARLRQRIIDEIGDEPGEALRDLHRKILQRDPGLDIPDLGHGGGSDPPSPVSAAASSAPPALLPRGGSAFVGREEQLRWLTAQLPAAGETEGLDHPSVTLLISGGAGVGKTALAVHWAHTVTPRFPDGQMYVDLRGYAAGHPMSPAEALASLLRGLGVPPKDIPELETEAAAVFRARTAGRRMLVLLDNATSAGQVRHLLPGVGCVAVVTSRDELAGLVARDGACPLKLGTLSPAESRALFAAMLGPDRVAAEPDAVSAVAALCGHLPLALRIAAARLACRPRQSISSYRARLRDSDRLSALAAPDDDQTAVRPAFDISYTRLPGDTRRTFRLLGLVPGPDFDLAATAALVDLPATRVEALLDQLVAASLLEERDAGRFAFHDLLRAYAAERAEQEDRRQQRDEALGRLHRYYLGTCVTAVEILYPHALRLLPSGSSGTVRATAPLDGSGDALEWLDREKGNLVSCVIHAATHGFGSTAWLLADAMRAYLQARGQASDWQAVADSALTAARSAGDLWGQASAHLSLARLHWSRNAHRESMSHARHVLTLADQGRWPEAAGAAQMVLGALHQRAGELESAAVHLTRATEHYRKAGRTHGELGAHATIGVVLLERGRLHEALSHTREALRLHAELDTRTSEGFAIGLRGEINRLLGRYLAALRDLTESLTRARSIGDLSGEGNALRSLAELHHVAGRDAQALASAEQGLAVARKTGNRRLEAEVAVTLARLVPGGGHHAAENWRRAVSLARDSGNLYPEVEAVVGLAQAQLSCAEHDEALESIHLALTMSRDAGLRLLEGRSMTVLASTCLSASRIDECLAHARAAVAVHRETGHRPGEVRTLTLLARARQHAGLRRTR